MNRNDRILGIAAALALTVACLVVVRVFLFDGVESGLEHQGTLETGLDAEEVVDFRRADRPLRHAAASEHRPVVDVVPIARPEAAEGTIVGLVLSGADSLPVAGARVRSELHFPRGETNYGLVSTHECETFTDEAGGFVLSVPGHGAYRVTVEKATYSPALIEEARAGETLELSLEAGSAVVGFVRREGGGEPVPDALLRIRRPEGDWRAETRSGPDGRYELAGLFPGTLFLSVEHDRHLTIEDAILELTAGQTLDHDLVLDPGKRIFGSVVDERGTPVAGAEISAGEKKTRSDDLGAFDLGGLATSGHGIQVVAEGFLTFQQQVNLSGSRNEAEVEVALRRGATIDVLVLDAAGAPVDGVEIKVFESWGGDQVWDSGNTRFVARTDADGRCTVTGLHQRGWGGYVVRARRPGSADAYSDQLKVNPERPTAVRLVLGSGGTIAGRVTDERDRPLEGVKLRLDLTDVYEWRGRDRDGLATALSDAEGRYRFESLAPRAYRVTALAPGFASQYRAGLEIQGDALLENVDFRLVVGTRIEGRVADEEGRGLAGAKVDVWSSGSRGSAITDENGDYALDTVAEGPFSARASLEGHGQQHKKDIYPEAGRIDFELGSTGRLEGRVREVETGTPVRPFRLELLRADPRRGGEWRSVEHRSIDDPTGSFRFHAEDGTYKVVVRARGYVLWEREGIAIAADSETESLEVQLRPGGGIEGWIRDQRGEPIPGVEVFVRHTSGEDVTPDFEQRAQSEGDGYFFVDSLTAGTYEVAVQQWGRVPLVIRPYVTVVGGDLLRFDPEVFPKGPVLVTAADEGEKPLRRANLKVRRLDGGPVIMQYHRWNRNGTIYRPRAERGFSLRSGELRIEDLAPGAYRFRLESKGYEGAEEDVIVESGRETAVAFVLRKPEGEAAEDPGVERGR